MRALARSTLLSLVIPCYNEEEVLDALFERVRAAALAWSVDIEVVLVDDGSRDRTWERILACHARDPRWKGVRLARNFGHQIALWSGLHAAKGDVVAVLDADLQDPPEELGRFLAKWAEGFDAVYAVREKRKEGPLMRLAYFAFYRILRFLSETEVPLDSGDFCVMDRRLLDVLLRMGDHRPFVRGLRAWVGFRQTGVAYERQARAAGEAKYTFKKLVGLALDGILSSSNRPLRLATYLGLAVSSLSFLGTILTLVQRIYAKELEAYGLTPPPGFATIVIALLFLGGVQLVCVGIMGEYVGRIYENVRGRPSWTAMDALGLDDAQRGRVEGRPLAARAAADPVSGTASST